MTQIETLALILGLIVLTIFGGTWIAFEFSDAIRDAFKEKG